jgi:transposase-like protein
MKRTLEEGERVKERGAFNKVLVFGILERNGVVKVEAIKKNVTAETLLNLTVKMVRRGSISYAKERLIKHHGVSKKLFLL